MARSTRSSSRRSLSRQSSSRCIPLPDSNEEDKIQPYCQPARLESPFGTERMAAAISILYPLKPEVLKVEYVKPQNFKYGTTVECARKLSQS